jgi:hypothetical protein
MRNVVELCTSSTSLANAGNSLQVALMSSVLVVVWRLCALALSDPGEAPRSLR